MCQQLENGATVLQIVLTAPLPPYDALVFKFCAAAAGNTIAAYNAATGELRLEAVKVESNIVDKGR